MSHLFKPIFLQSITPLHIGCGQDVGVVDLPVIRERTTGFPFVPGSGLRGSLRARAMARDEPLATRLFGKTAGDEGAGCLSVLEARLLLFPVRSAPGLFRWITCPYVLDRWAADCEIFLGSSAGCAERVSGDEAPNADQFLGAANGPSKIWLEEYEVARDGELSWTPTIAGVDKNLVIVVSDELFRDLTELATVVVQRNRLTAEKVVDGGALFSVEAVPPQAVFYGFVGATRERSPESGRSSESTGPEPRMDNLTVLSRLPALVANAAAQSEQSVALFLGGDESVGYGMTRLQWWSGQ
jgi:CRISPR-associated protein Cmr4